MEKKLKPKIYAVHIVTTLKKPSNKFIHVGVKRYYQEDGILYIEEEKRTGARTLYQYDLSHVKEIRVREVIKGKI